jgi:cardiolipin synthase
MPTPPSPASWLTVHSAVVLLALAAYVLASLGRRQRRHPSSAVAWVVSLALMPYIALPLFMLFGMRKTVRALRSAPAAQGSAGNGLQATASGRLQALAIGLGMPPALPYEQLELHEDGAAALERLKLLLREARETIDISTFLVGNDAIGAELCALLAQRAGEGVQVRLMMDGVGRYLGGNPSLRALRHAGARVRLFASPWSSPLLGGRANLRNHRKMVIADGQWLWSGGRNLAAEYFVPVRHAGGRLTPAWRDLSFDLRGMLVEQVQAQFEADWRTAGREAAVAQGPRIVRPASEGPVAQFLPSGPDQGDDTVHALLVDACFNARHRLLAITPYFVPDAVLLMALVLAARRGIEVDIIVPRRSNHRLADLARPAALRELAEAGARIWLVPQMVHAKLVVVDQSVAFCGSLNLDERSLFLNYEMMVAFYDPPAVKAFAHWAQALRGSAQPLVHHRVGVLREFGEGLLRWLTFQL